MLILTFADYLKQSQQLARVLDVACQVVDVHHFPDGENKVCLPAELPEHVVFCRSLNNPNDKLIELLLSAETARQMGASKLTLVAPYLCYMRQDSAFSRGEAVSQRIICRWLGDMFDTIVTVDPHLHRVEQLSELFPDTQTVTLSATALMGAVIRAHFSTSPLLLGPDSESEQWVKQVADSAALHYTICHKTRHGDHDVDVHLGDCDLADRDVVIIDDIASTGQTLATAARNAQAAGAASISCMVTHTLLDREGERNLRNSGVKQVWSSDSISHPSNAIQLAELLATALQIPLPDPPGLLKA